MVMLHALSGGEPMLGEYGRRCAPTSTASARRCAPTAAIAECSAAGQPHAAGGQAGRAVGSSVGAGRGQLPKARFAIRSPREGGRVGDAGGSASPCCGASLCGGAPGDSEAVMDPSSSRSSSMCMGAATTGAAAAKNSHRPPASTRSTNRSSTPHDQPHVRCDGIAESHRRAGVAVHRRRPRVRASTPSPGRVIHVHLNVCLPGTCGRPECKAPALCRRSLLEVWSRRRPDLGRPFPRGSLLGGQPQERYRRARR